VQRQSIRPEKARRELDRPRPGLPPQCAAARYAGAVARQGLWSGRPAGRQRHGALTLGGGDQDAATTLALANPKLWGIDHPDLYRLVVDLRGSDGRALDLHSDTFGVRTVEIRDRHLLINGERLRLTGLARHEDSPAEGWPKHPRRCAATTRI